MTTRRYRFGRHLALGALLIAAVAVAAFFLGGEEDPDRGHLAVAAGAVLGAAVLARWRIYLPDALVAAALIAFFISQGLWEDQRIRRLRKIPAVTVAELAALPEDVIFELKNAVRRADLAASIARPDEDGAPASHSAIPIVAPDWEHTRPVVVWSAKVSPGDRVASAVEAVRYAFPLFGEEREGTRAAAELAAEHHGLVIAKDARFVELVADPRLELGQRLMVHFYLPIGLFMLWAAGVVVAAAISTRRHRLRAI